MAKDKKNLSTDADESAAENKKSTKKAKKSAKTETKQNVFQKIGKWFHDLNVEFRNVTWPTRQTVVVNTSVVLSVIVAGSVIIGLMDAGLLKLIQYLISVAQG
ncbi:MAG: preprotein translocase subunit SecE [Oscillospiraceae bacterium]|nr:preprotein translocase subunit SecE [Oscillospiraceae bacterium]